jgi:hypothetical protein
MFSRRLLQIGAFRCTSHTLSDSAVVPFSLKDPDTILPTIISGLQIYFDRSLGSNLLYRFERPQYAEVRKKYVTGPKVQLGQEKEMSSIYGAEHLLRMLGENFGFSQDTCSHTDLDDHQLHSPRWLQVLRWTPNRRHL